MVSINVPSAAAAQASPAAPDGPLHLRMQYNPPGWRFGKQPMMLDVVLRREADTFRIERAEVADAPGAPPRFGGIGRWSSYSDGKRDTVDRQFPQFSALLDAVEGAAGTLERFLVANPNLRDEKYRQRTADNTWALALMGPDKTGATKYRTEYWSSFSKPTVPQVDQGVKALSDFGSMLIQGWDKLS